MKPETDTITQMVRDCGTGWPALDWMRDGVCASGALVPAEGMELRADVHAGWDVGYEGKLVLTVRATELTRSALVRIEFGHTTSTDAAALAAMLEGVLQAAPVMVAALLAEATDRVLGSMGDMRASVGGAG